MTIQDIRKKSVPIYCCNNDGCPMPFYLYFRTRECPVCGEDVIRKSKEAKVEPDLIYDPPATETKTAGPAVSEPTKPTVTLTIGTWVRAIDYDGGAVEGVYHGKANNGPHLINIPWVGVRACRSVSEFELPSCESCGQVILR